MQINIAIYVVSIVSTIFLSIVILKSSVSQKVKRNFSFLCLSAAFWAICLLIADNSKNIEIVTWASKVAVIGPAWVPLFFVLFSEIFPKEYKKISLFTLILLFIPPVVLSVLAFLDNFSLVSVSIQRWGADVKPGILYIFLLVIFVFYFGYAIYNLISHYKTTQDILEKKQILLIIFGIVIASLIGLITNVVLVLVGYSNLGFLGPPAILIFVGFITYAILKHQFLNIKVILTETATVLVTLAILVQTLLSRDWNEGLLNGTILIVVIYGGFLLIKSAHQEIKMREQLQEDKKRLMEIDRMKDEFLQMATHELNTPIAVIEGKSSMIMDEDMGGFTPEQKKFLRSITDNSTRLAHLAKDMLNVTRIDQKRLTLVKSEANLVEMASKIVADLQFKAKKKNDTLTFEKPSQFLPKFFVDQTKIAEVFNNLIINAIKFTQDGTIIVKIEPKDGEVIVSVKDTGIGISKEDQTQLFEKFHQIDRFDHQSPVEQQGTGLGLYISKKLIELHQGRIWLESELNKGTTFYFSLPANQQKDKVQNG